MASAQDKADQFQWRVRPGLLLFFFSILALAIYDKTGLDYSLAGAPAATKRAILLVPIIATAVGWFLLGKDFGSFRSWHKWTALAGAALLTFSILDYVSYTMIPIKFMLPFYAFAELLLWRWKGVVVGLAWIVPLLGRGRSRIAFVVAGTVMLFLWVAAG